MMTLLIGGKEYKVKFSYNSFADTDLMERTETLIKVFDDDANKDDKYGMARIKDLFVCVRDLLYAGFQKYNPVESKEELGDLLDTYCDEGTEENPHDLLELFTQLTDELMNQGFLRGLLSRVTQQGAKKTELKVVK